MSPSKTDYNEKKLKANWLTLLNAHGNYWVDGDYKNLGAKTADFVNQKFKIAIELKSEDNSLDDSDKNMTKMSSRLQGYFKRANRKFANYPTFRTLLIVEIRSSVSLLHAVMQGITILLFDVNGNVIGTAIKNERLYESVRNIGTVIFWVANGTINGAKGFYFDNPFSGNERKLMKSEVENIVNCKLSKFELGI